MMYPIDNIISNRKSLSEQTQDSLTLLFLLVIFFFSPFLAFIIALTQAKKTSSYVIYVLWSLIFVWHMNPTETGRYDDLVGIMERVISTDVTIDQVINDLYLVLTFSPDAPKEWYEEMMIWLSKSITQNPHFYFVLCAIPWLYFELSSLHRITSDKKFRQSIICLVILLLFVVPRDLLTLQNPRFTTATWMAIYATLGFFLGGKNRLGYVILIFLLPLVHSAFWFYIGCFIVGLVMYRYRKLSLWMLCASIPFSYLSYELLFSINFTELPLPSTMSVWISRYMSEDFYNKYVADEGASGFFWITSMFDVIMKTSYLLIPLYLIKERELYNSNQKLWNLCGFFFFFYALVSFIQFVPVLGERFYWLVRILGIFLWFKAIFPRHNYVIWMILFGCSWGLFKRYFYHGAVESVVPLEIFYEPFPMAITDML